MARSSLIPFGLGGGSDPMMSMRRDINRMFDDVFRAAPFGGREAGAEQWSPALFNANMNVSETDNEVRVSVELPGVKEEDIDVSLHDDLLTIRGEKKFESERGGEKENFHFVERSYGSFQRSLRLPFAANPEEVKAAFQNGVLILTVPKSAQMERSHRIQIQKGAMSGEASQQAEQPAMTSERTDRAGEEQRPATH